MDNTLDNTSLSTIALLEDRLSRLEHLLYGTSTAPTRPSADSAVESLVNLERRYASLLSHVRVYAELLKIHKAHPSLLQSSSADDTSVPTELSPEAVRATVLSYATAFPSTASALTAVTSDTPIPDPALSAKLVGLAPRMKGIEAMQLAQEAEIAELRARSEIVMRTWYEGRVLRYGHALADVTGRIEKVERTVRRAEKLRELDSAA